MTLLERQVGFGDAAGPLMHPEGFFDLLLSAFEELGGRFEESPADVVAEDRVPYAPVSTTGRIDGYPLYRDVVRVDGAPVDVGERRFTTGYTFETERDLGRGWIDHVTIDADGRAEPLAPGLRDRLESLSDGGPEPPPGDPVEPSAGPTAFEWTTTVRSPHLEAAGLVYFAEYARFLTLALENHLDRRGVPLGSLRGDRYPFLPVGWHLDFRRPVRIEDRLAVRGRVAEVSRESVTVRYEVAGGDGESGEDVRFEGQVRYGSFEPDGHRTTFGDRALDAVR